MLMAGEGCRFMGTLRSSLERLYNSKIFNVVALGIIAAIILIAYSNTFTASFHFDDTNSIEENALIKRVTADNIMAILNGVRPVTYLSIMLNYQLSGLHVVGWHIFNIAFHIANSFFVYLLISWTLSLPPFEKKYSDRAKRMALFASLLFAVHPVQTEAVTYIISRTELLATFFYLAAFLLFIRGTQKHKPLYYVGVFFSALLSMGSKEWAVTLPAMLMLYDYMFLSEKNVKNVLSHWKAYVLAALPWALIAHNLNLTATGGTASLGFNIVTTSGITPVTYLLTSFNVLWTYVRLLLLPINQNLDYDYPIAKTLLEFPTLLSFLGHLAVVGMSFWLYKKRGWLLIPFGVAWFYIALSPVQSFVPIIDVIFEHRLYMPSIGFFLLFVVAYENLFEWWEVRQFFKKRTVV
jgi:hypothetical protein